MAIHVEHELHTRRLGRNVGVGLLLAGFVALVFGLTVVKVMQLGDVNKLEGYDHVLQPQNIPALPPASATGTGGKS
ncbi:MAG: hypothetical protein GC146_17490 [Limimaricola sp.]|uniref:hypothetical protein n=1 Tax=Limimaricola sp. TaxID=2211665 RepID=UPI001D53C497|nr:hypothetical protein [Limimaricola sp.]MBI1419006.1 hypothetical protein [Limimaricola sp.]